ncbi:hypothetical protein [uncultured Ruegeria sp.]|uniref:hypothetical protein n=1 Tax=uncultured Ruegeria sp. TaxID=259304 RepID=UPI00260ED619|nr:hypothetical protein [uncultured Ruegeria sp.]
MMKPSTLVSSLITLVVSTGFSLAENEKNYSISEPEEPIIWIEEWFDGCAALSNSTKVTISKMTLDADCVAQALDYCIGNISSNLEELCHTVFVDHLQHKSSEILSSLPAQVSLTGFNLKSYESAVERTSRSDSEACDETMPELRCQLLVTTLRWLDLRYAQRLLKDKGE